MSQTYIFNINPMGAPRMSRQDRFLGRPVVIKFRDFGKVLRFLAKKDKFILPYNNFQITFHIPMPPSWSGKKKKLMNNTPHQLRPDIDNLFKGFTDSLFYEKGKHDLSDCLIHDVRMSKVWSGTGKIEVKTYDISTV